MFHAWQAAVTPALEKAIEQCSIAGVPTLGKIPNSCHRASSNVQTLEEKHHERR
jgi:Mrp family chromosome partitioning ATPase